MGLHFEYAIDPHAVADRRDLSRLADSVGWYEGRLLSLLPRDWFKELDKRVCCWNLPAVDKARALLLLARLKRGTVERHPVRWNGTKTWLANMEEAHTLSPFRLVIGGGSASAAETPATLQAVVAPCESLDLTDPRWQTDPTPVRREADDLIASVDLMLRCAREVRLVDPHVRPRDQRYTRVIERVLRLVARTEYRSAPGSLELHTKARDSNGRSAYEEWLKGKVPRGMRMRVLFWREQDGGQQLHNRYILTNQGGVAFGHGLDAAEGREETFDDVTRMSTETHRLRWGQYDRNARAFVLDSEPLVLEGK